MAITADPSGTTAPAPTIQSDKADYAPGELVTLTGSNWQPGESVHINVNDDQGQTWSYDSNPDVQADANGNISHTFNLPSSFVATYKVTATGAQSGVATTSFTDGNLAFALATSGNAAPSNLTWSVNWDQWQGTGQNPNNTCAGTRSANGTANFTGNNAHERVAARNQRQRIRKADRRTGYWEFREPVHLRLLVVLPDEHYSAYKR
jgi:hypothetical protein